MNLRITAGCSWNILTFQLLRLAACGVAFQRYTNTNSTKKGDCDSRVLTNHHTAVAVSTFILLFRSGV